MSLRLFGENSVMDDLQLFAEGQDGRDLQSFDVLEEIQRLRLEGKNDNPSPLVFCGSKESAVLKPCAPVAAISSQVLRRREALEIGMAKAYSNFTAASQGKGGPIMRKRQKPQIDVSQFLPPGYNPKLDQEHQPRPPHKPRSTARPGRHAAVKNSNARGILSTGLEQHLQPRQFADLKKCMTVTFDDPESAFTSHVNSTEVARTAVASPLETARQVHTMLLAFVPAALFLRQLIWRYECNKQAQSSAAQRIQHFYRHHVRPSIFLHYWKAVRWPLRMRLCIRIKRKRNALKKLVVFFNEHAQVPWLAIAKKFMSNLTRCHRIMKDFLVISRARAEAVRRFWQRTEHGIRKRLAIRERKLMEKLKQEQKERILASAKKSGAGKSAGSIHAKWLSQAANVQVMLQRAEMVQAQSRASIGVTTRQLRKAGLVSEEHSIDGSEQGNPAASASGSSDCEAHEQTFDAVPAAERDQIIAAAIQRKRRAHILNVVRDSQERARTRGMVGLEDAKDYIKARGARHHSSLVDINHKMMSGLQRVHRRAADVDLPRARNGFRMFTDTEIGVPWYKIVYEAVMQDMAKLRDSEGTRV